MNGLRCLVVAAALGGACLAGGAAAAQEWVGYIAPDFMRQPPLGLKRLSEAFLARAVGPLHCARFFRVERIEVTEQKMQGNTTMGVWAHLTLTNISDRTLDATEGATPPMTCGASVLEGDRLWAPGEQRVVFSGFFIRKAHQPKRRPGGTWEIMEDGVAF